MNKVDTRALSEGNEKHAPLRVPAATQLTSRAKEQGVEKTRRLHHTSTTIPVKVLNMSFLLFSLDAQASSFVPAYSLTKVHATSFLNAGR